MSITDAAVHTLRANYPSDKVSAAHRMSELWNNQSLIYANSTNDENDQPNEPGRPDRPKLVHPRDVKKRRLGSVEGRFALMHAIAHIEFNAINLAADMVARYSFDARISDQVRNDFIADWVQVCDDEARHFTMIQDRLIELGGTYGDLPAHDGLWDAAKSTSQDLAARLVIAPMVLEARGLDVTPNMIEKLKRVGDHESAQILTTIYNEEIAHVAAGVKWFEHISKNEKRDSTTFFQNLLKAHFKGDLKPPFNVEARNLAGLKREFYHPELS